MNEQVPIATIGDNQPPSEFDLFKENLLKSVAPIVRKVQEQTAALTRVPEEITADNEGVVTDFIDQCQTILREAETLRKGLKKPYDDRGKAIQAELGPKSIVVVDIGKLLGPVKERHDAYVKIKDATMRAEAAKAAEENTEKAEAEKAAALAATQAALNKARAAETGGQRDAAVDELAAAQTQHKQAEATQAVALEQAKAAQAPIAIRGEYGGRAYLTSHETFEVENWDHLSPLMLWPYIDKEAKLKAIRAAIKNGVTDMVGVRIFTDKTTVVRSA